MADTGPNPVITDLDHEDLFPKSPYSGGAKTQLSGFFGENTTGMSCPMVGQLAVSTAIRW